MVKRVVPGPVTTYRLTEWDGTPVEGQFYEEDRKRITVPDNALFHVEKIVQRHETRIKV